MTYVRLGFLGAFLLLLVGGYAARAAVAPYFSQAGEIPSPAVSTTPAQVDARRATASTATAIIVTATPTPRVIVVTPRAVQPRPQPSHTLPATRRRGPRATPTHPRVSRAALRRTPTPVPTAIPTATSLPTPTPLPTPVPTTGIVALNNYWVNSQSVRPGQVISLGYVIRNDTGRTERISLGASLKARSAPSWTAAINDPYHDVVAIVPPGATVHVRYFTLPSGLRPGEYDVAWGLRDADTGRRLGLAFAPAVVTVTR